MPNKSEDIKADLMEAIYLVLNPTITKEHQLEIVSFMKARGHDMVWNAIRYEETPLLSLSCPHNFK
jgi:hypothetical protein